MASRSKQADPPKPAGAAGYTVLARRYRSRDFDELIGQEPIANTLQNAIRTNRTAHAYLFCGTRGVGKTSMARIFAKALNATDHLQQKDQVADAILRGEDLDVIEIDAASNRGIDNARDLIAGASLMPARSPFKIYIIDEVHMLTREAFNALLKTMEEPPGHVKFILCTTEANKVPATIQSRCQRFDFRPIPTSKIAEQLKLILKKEGIAAEDEVVAQVARLGNGSMRDALSLLDRLLAGGERTLTNELLEQMLGVPDYALVSELVDAIVESDAKRALDRGAQLLGGGATVEQALELLAEHFRNMMIIAACGADAEFLDLSEEHRRAAARQAANFDAPALAHMIAICDAVARNVRHASSSRAIFDATLVRLAMSQHFADIAALLAGQPPQAPAQPALVTGDPKKKAAGLDNSKPSVVQRENPGPAGDGRALEAPGHAARTSSAPHDRVAEVKPVADDQLWSRVQEVAGASIADKSRTEHLVFESFDGRTLRLSIDEGGADCARFLCTQTDKIADLVKRATGRSVVVELDASRFQQRSTNQASNAATTGPVPPIVQKAMDLFDATLVAVEPHAQPGRPSEDRT